LQEQVADFKQLPERWFRRRFDIFGTSHQVFHVMVVVAAFTYFKGMLQAFDYVHFHDNIACSRV
jgi:adiponectin receptor